MPSNIALHLKTAGITTAGILLFVGFIFVISYYPTQSGFVFGVFVVIGLFAIVYNRVYNILKDRNGTN